MFDRNEVFNTGFGQGDGGAIYADASLAQGYGMSFRGNFIHHLIETPGLHGRGGIYWDDHFQAVSNCSGNVMFKAAGRAFLVHSGGANNVTNNLIVNSGIGLWNDNSQAQSAVHDLPLYDNGTLKRGDKGDFIWRTEQDFGVASLPELLASSFSQHFPTFKAQLAINASTSGWASPALSNFAENCFLNNSVGDVCFSTSYHNPNGTQCDDAMRLNGGDRFIDSRGAVEAQWSWFPRHDELDFSLQRGKHRFDTASAGLECDGWRRRAPAKSSYRRWVKASLLDLSSAAAKDARYSPEAALRRTSLRSGEKLVHELSVPCPATPRHPNLALHPMN